MATVAVHAFPGEPPYGQLQHFARYLKAIMLRLDKYRANPVRDAARMAELRTPQPASIKRREKL